MRMLATVWPIFLLPVLAIISASWSPDPSLTLRHAFALLGTVFFGLSLASTYDFKSSLQLLIRVLVIAMVLSAFWALVFPQSGVHQASDVVEPIHAGKWRGIFAHKNSLGAIAGFTLALLALYGRCVFNTILLRFGAITITFMCLLFADSGNGFAVAFVVIVTGFLISVIAKAPPNIRLLLVLNCLAVLVFLSFFASDLEALALKALGKDPDLTGRTEYWGYILSFMDANWVLGYGYLSGFLSIEATIESITGFNFVSTHSGFLDVLVSFGIVGVVTAGGYLLWLLRNAVSLILWGPAELGALTVFPLSAIVFIIQTNLVESVILLPNSPYPLILAISASMIARRKLVYSPAVWWHSIRNHR
jgi:O-antigen ligase